MDLTIAILLGIFLLLFFLTALFWLYVWWKKTVYTREKFAFAGLTAASALTLFVVTSVYANEPPWLAFIGLIKQILGLPYQPPPPPTWEQHFVSVVVVGLLWMLIFRIHRDWTGARSVNHQEQLQKAQPPNPFADARLYLHPNRNHALLTVYDSAQQGRPTALQGAEESLVWHEQARDLLMLSNNRYDFPDDAWHEEAGCWIGTHTGTGDTLVLACRDERPDGTELRELADYVEKVRRNQGRNGHGLTFIVALKDGDMDEPSQFGDHKMRTVSESRLLDSLVNFAPYFRALCERVEKDELMGSELTLGDVYTPSRYKLSKEGAPLPGLEDFLNAWLAEPGQRQIALLGEYGQGKSTASLMLSYHLMQRLRDDPHSARVPLLLELRGKSPRTLTENQLLAIWAQPYGIDPRALLKLLVAGRLLLIFEGFDEVDLVGNSDVRIAHFKNMWGLCYPKAKILVTGRPNYFLDDDELKTALGIQNPSLERPYCQAVYLAPFDFGEIGHSLRKLDADTRDGILDLARKNERFLDIAARPSMLHVVSTLWRRENLAQYGQRINSALVMDLFVRHSYERQGGKAQKFAFTPPSGGKAKPDFMALNTRERAYFMEGIATFMLVNDLPNQISGRQLEDVVRILVEAIPDAVSEMDAQSGETRKPLRKRFELESHPENLETILTDVRACGLLVPDLSRNGSFKFGHKSFMEFLAGKVFAQWSLRKELVNAKEKSVSSLVNTLRLKMRHVVQQTEVMEFATEWIAENARKHNQATEILFRLIFKAHSLGTRLALKTLKASIACMPLTLMFKQREIGVKTESLIFNLVYLTPWTMTFLIEFGLIKTGLDTEVKRLQVAFFIFASMSYSFHNYIVAPGRFTRFETVGTLSIVAVILINYRLKDYFALNEYRNLAFSAITLSLMYLLIIFIESLRLGFEFSRTLSEKPSKMPTDSKSAWMFLRIWHAICTAAHLDRSAIASVIGKRPLRLLEEVAAKEPRPWTIAESLEKLKARPGAD